MHFGLFHSVQWPPGSDQQARYRQALDEALESADPKAATIQLIRRQSDRGETTAVDAALRSELESLRLKALEALKAQDKGPS